MNKLLVLGRCGLLAATVVTATAVFPSFDVIAQQQATTVTVTPGTPLLPTQPKPSPQQASQPSPVIIQQGMQQPPPKLPAMTLPSPPVVSVDSSRRAVGPQGMSGPVCGGIANGRPQPACGAAPARFEANAAGNCPAGSFLDIGTWSCWTCPDGYGRTVEAVDSVRACARADSSVRGEFLKATFGGKLCPDGSFFDPIRGGECWSCPKGYNRSAAHIDAPNACFIAAGERLSRANRVKNTIWPHECPPGSFHDVWDGGACWRCPDGYRRTANHINSAGACSASVAEQQAKAGVVKKAGCEAGEFQDPRNGGECWSCPKPATRTVYPVDGDKACEKWAGYRYAKASQKGALTCPAGQVFDLASSKRAEVQQRIRTQAGGGQMPRDVGTSDGGTCWSCPSGYVRTTSPVWANDACASGLIDWRPAHYAQPGLFGLDGAEEVALAMVRQRKSVDRAAESMAEDLRVTPAEARRLAWEEIATRPQDSAALKAAVLERIKEAIRNPQSATEAERRLIRGFAEAAGAFRQFMAQNALDAYDAWKAAVEYQKQQAQRPGQQHMISLIDFGRVPPDFDSIMAGTILAGLGTGGAAATAWTLANINKSARPNLMTRNRLKARINELNKLEGKVGQIVEKQVVPKLEQQAGKGLSKIASRLSSVMRALGSAGPQIIITVAVEMIAEATERIIDIQNARPLLLAKLGSARQGVDLGRLLKTDEGTVAVEGYWSTAMSGETPARNASAFAQVVAGGEVR